MEFFHKHKKPITIAIVLFLVLTVAYFLYQKNQAVPMATISGTSPSAIAEGQLKTGAFKSMNDAKQVSKAIEKRIKDEPDISFVTKTQQEADAKANAIAKQEGADYVLKKSTTPEPSTDTNASQDESAQIKNDYYAIHLDKKYELAAGITSIDGKVHFTAAVQADKVTMMVHTKDLKTIDGATVLYTIKKW